MELFYGWSEQGPDRTSGGRNSGQRDHMHFIQGLVALAWDYDRIMGLRFLRPRGRRLGVAISNTDDCWLFGHLHTCDSSDADSCRERGRCTRLWVYVRAFYHACTFARQALLGSAVAVAEAAISSNAFCMATFFHATFCQVGLPKFGQIGLGKGKVMFISGRALALTEVGG
ncbi:hypothetical protein EmuJ_001177400 [Echinococcus multilocularis]|uniref:Uncharacterized protein n=1 Tax=Echinococcus multilocularis TaxID=6211 RepID=A0A068XYA7_ECHMU|nr:hypothetical protein EmuJ_001177400 [Echinococcus multilocularis]